MPDYARIRPFFPNPVTYLYQYTIINIAQVYFILAILIMVTVLLEKIDNIL